MARMLVRLVSVNIAMADKETDFSDRPDNEMSPELKGIIAAAYSLGAILSLPFIGLVNDKFGRRVSIFGGSAIMVAGALIQGFSINCKSVLRSWQVEANRCSRYVHRRPPYAWIWYPDVYCLWVLAHWGVGLP